MTAEMVEPMHPQSKAAPHLRRWRNLVGLADRAGHLVPVGRGGERRAIGHANPSLGGRLFATPTPWAAIHHLMPGEDAPEHRHTQNAFRFVVEGEGVWTVVGRDPVPMRRGDFLPQADGTGTATGGDVLPTIRTESTGSAPAPGPLRARRPAPRSSRSSTAPAWSPSAPSSGPSPAGTCSSRRGGRSRSARRRARTTPTPARSTSTVFSDSPIFEALHLDRVRVEGTNP